jgi:hypothetical protein
MADGTEMQVAPLTLLMFPIFNDSNLAPFMIFQIAQICQFCY